MQSAAPARRDAASPWSEVRGHAARLRAHVPRHREADLVYAAFLGCGLAVGLAVALPVHWATPAECPPADGGLVACQLTKGPVRALTTLGVVLLAFHGLARMALGWGPDVRARRSRGQPLLLRPPGVSRPAPRLAQVAPREPWAPYEADPVVRAAQRVRHERRVAELDRLWVEAARGPAPAVSASRVPGSRA